jgi:hypothetical protein
MADFMFQQKQIQYGKEQNNQYGAKNKPVKAKSG